MAGETRQIRSEIAETRQEIDSHLQELGGRVESTFDVQQQARQNLPQVLAGVAAAGLALGFLVGHGGGSRRMERLLALEEARLARERGRLQGAIDLAEIGRESYDIP